MAAEPGGRAETQRVDARASRGAVHPVTDRDSLADLEQRVLDALDPPLNLDEMGESEVRLALKARRAEFSFLLVL